MGAVDDATMGLLEGDESSGCRLGYKLLLFLLVVLTLVGIILAICSDHGVTSILAALVALGLQGSIFVMIKWYRTEGLPAKFRRLVYGMMFLLLLINIFNITLFTIKNAEDPTPMPTPAPGPPEMPICYNTNMGCPDPRVYQTCLQNLRQQLRECGSE